jgi:hypothetical protein
LLLLLMMPPPLLPVLLLLIVLSLRTLDTTLLTHFKPDEELYLEVQCLEISCFYLFLSEP